ncbi:MAG: 4Fe-4S dicluster domain-containing protein [Deltaproteobacteria bacterium]|nr:4Fe-4S dicluster domain-containing protein [Deltaproteobacteria bacterium]MBW2255049.1 4Fe-4S dicluster domain-containing protein [Deltaproteobacteria bacterium]
MEATESGGGPLKVTEELVPIYIMGKRYEVPASLTIMKAMEYAGYQYIRGAGCRGGICGACATVYRKPGDYHIRVGLACQTVVEPDMYLTQIPFFPANRTPVDFEALEGTPEDVYNAYPELFRCVACNACSKVCPMDVPVMDYIAAIKQGDLEKATELSFDCIQCGLCATRCMGELAQYHIAQLVRRIYGSKLAPHPAHLDTMVEQITAGRYVEALAVLMAMDTESLKKLYVEREMEPAMTPEDWTPQDSTYL